MNLKIAVLPGDGIGPEIIEQGVAVMDKNSAIQLNIEKLYVELRP